MITRADYSAAKDDINFNRREIEEVDKSSKNPELEKLPANQKIAGLRTLLTKLDDIGEQLDNDVQKIDDYSKNTPFGRFLKKWNEFFGTSPLNKVDKARKEISNIRAGLAKKLLELGADRQKKGIKYTDAFAKKMGVANQEVSWQEFLKEKSPTIGRTDKQQSKLIEKPESAPPKGKAGRSKSVDMGTKLTSAQRRHSLDSSATPIDTSALKKPTQKPSEEPKPPDLPPKPQKSSAKPPPLNFPPELPRQLPKSSSSVTTQKSDKPKPPPSSASANAQPAPLETNLPPLPPKMPRTPVSQPTTSPEGTSSSLDDMLSGIHTSPKQQGAPPNLFEDLQELPRQQEPSGAQGELDESLFSEEMGVRQRNAPEAGAGSAPPRPQFTKPVVERMPAGPQGEEGRRVGAYTEAEALIRAPLQQKETNELFADVRDILQEMGLNEDEAIALRQSLFRKVQNAAIQQNPRGYNAAVEKETSINLVLKLRELAFIGVKLAIPARIDVNDLADRILQGVPAKQAFEMALGALIPEKRVEIDMQQRYQKMRVYTDDDYNKLTQKLVALKEFQPIRLPSLLEDVKIQDAFFDSLIEPDTPVSDLKRMLHQEAGKPGFVIGPEGVSSAAAPARS